MNTDKHRFFKHFLKLFFVCFVCFVGNLFAQQTQFETLYNQIKNGSVEEKRSALYQIRNLETAESSKIAVSALQDSSEIIRGTATHSILWLDSNEAVTLLLPLLNDKFPFVREETCYALGKTKNKAATLPMIRILEKDKSNEVRGACAFGLGLIADNQAFDILVKLLNNKNLFVQRSSARSLGQIGDKRAIPILEKISQDKKRDDDVKREANESLEKLTADKKDEHR